MPHLDVPAVAGDQGARTFDLLAGEITVGRGEGNDLVIIHGTLSRRHCAFFAADGGGWGVRDLGSGNGVVIDEQRITGDVELADGDEVKLGSVILVYRDAAAAADADDDDDVEELGALDIIDETQDAGDAGLDFFE